MPFPGRDIVDIWRNDAASLSVDNDDYVWFLPGTNGFLQQQNAESTVWKKIPCAGFDQLQVLGGFKVNSISSGTLDIDECRVTAIALGLPDEDSFIDEPPGVNVNNMVVDGAIASVDARLRNSMLMCVGTEGTDPTNSMHGEHSLSACGPLLPDGTPPDDTNHSQFYFRVSHRFRADAAPSIADTPLGVVNITGLANIWLGIRFQVNPGGAGAGGPDDVSIRGRILGILDKEHVNASVRVGFE